MTRRIVVLSLMFAAAAAGAYTYYSTDDFSNGMDPGKWQTNGTLGVSGGLLTTTDANGGSIISIENVPDGTSEYEAKMTLRLAGSGGSYVTYLRASSDARLSPSGSTGTFYAFEVQSPTITSSGCSATLKGYKVVNGVSTLLIMSSIYCRDGMVVRAIARGNYLLAWIDNLRYGMIDNDIAAGKAGAGVYGAPAGNGASAIQLGPADRTAPWQVNPATVATSIYPSFVYYRSLFVH
jgi:hypothetical protein